ncbi:hypothetical protein AJ87_03750 [Rhizobium yanglingense]|nr:hypothetical protein AJ87_03750 [Rhizobium yanglingense]
MHWRALIARYAAIPQDSHHGRKSRRGGFSPPHIRYYRAPDAGKTTLTEKLLLFGGAIQLAGEVKAKKDRIQTRSDWMKIERERGISVVTSVMTFEYDDNVFNILDTPGHEDFADDTYRTLTAVDAAVMVIDAAKGIEPRTLKLFEVCRMRDIPIITFINKMDRESRDPFEILDEVEEKLALDTAPITWPIGRSKTFCGSYHLATNMCAVQIRKWKQRRSTDLRASLIGCRKTSGLPSSTRRNWRWRLAVPSTARLSSRVT